MQSNQNHRLWGSLGVLVIVFLCASLHGANLNPELQFLDVVNNCHAVVRVHVVDYIYKDHSGRDPGLAKRRASFVILANAEEHSAALIDRILQEKSVRGPGFKVSPGGRARLPEALRSGMRPLVLEFERPPSSSHPQLTVTDRFQVSNDGENTFLRGKQLTLTDECDYKVEPVGFFDGPWWFRHEGSNGEVMEWRLDLSHPSGDPNISGTLTTNEGQRAQFSGELNGRLMTFRISAGGGALSGHFEITPGGIWEGRGTLAGEGEEISGPIRLEVDYLYKTVLWK